MPTDTNKDQPIVASYLATGSMTGTCKEFGIRPNRLYQILYAAGVPRGYGRSMDLNRRAALTGEQAEAVISRHAAGEDAEVLAREYGCSSWVIAKTVKRAGLKTHARGGRLRKLSEDQEADVARLYSQGMSQEEVAAVVGVSQPVVSRTLISAGVQRRGPHVSGEDHGNWVGGVVETQSGYLMELVTTQDPLACMRTSMGYVPQHRLIMARHLGRPLSRKETVHHINGNRKDNRIENLQIRHGKHGKGVVLACRCCGSSNIVATEIN